MLKKEAIPSTFQTICRRQLSVIGHPERDQIFLSLPIRREKVPSAEKLPEPALESPTGTPVGIAEKAPALAEEDPTKTPVREQMYCQSVEKLSAENTALKERLSVMESQRFTISRFEDRDHTVQYYTGFQSYCLFHVGFEYLEPQVKVMPCWRGFYFDDTPNTREDRSQDQPVAGRPVLPHPDAPVSGP